MDAGHYTQVVWAKSLRIGCGVTYCPSLKGSFLKNGMIIGCRYLPGGNYMGQAPYVNSSSNCNTCAAMNYQCGTFTDNCSKTVTCNSCNSSEKCVNHKCVPNSCTPKTVCNKDYECGRMHDGCGWYVDCGTCPAGLKCNPNTHKCGTCDAYVYCPAAYVCGTINDTCGGEVNCGRCPSGYSCNYEEHKCEDDSWKKRLGMGLGIFFGILVFIAIIAVVTIVLIKKGIFVPGKGIKPTNDPARAKPSINYDMEVYAGTSGAKYQESAPPSRPPKQAPPPSQGNKAPPPPPRGGGGRAPPPPPRR